jgi:glycosyltransferase involved in cell wall biosynthesis
MPVSEETRSRLLVIVPAYNEELALPGTLKDLSDNRPDADVLVVDDGSSDDTSGVARSLGCKVVTLPNNLGIGGAVQTGLIYADNRAYDFAVQFDADGQHVASEIEKILSPVREDKCDVAIGSRFLASGGGFKSSAARRMGIRLFQWVISVAIRKKVADSTSGFRAFNSDAIRFLAYDYPCDYPEVEAVVILAVNGYRLTEVPVTMRERQAGTSSIRTVHSVYYMIKVMLAILMSLLRGATVKRHDSAKNATPAGKHDGS